MHKNNQTEPDPLAFEVTDSPTETARFQRLVKRYTLTGSDEKDMLHVIAKDAPDLAIVRIPTDRSERICDDVVMGDCLVIDERDNERYGEPGPLRNPGLKLRVGTDADIPVIDELTEIIFEGYRNLIRATVKLFMEEDPPMTKVSTQIDTLPVQRVWSTEGFHLNRAYYTLRLNLAGQVTQDRDSQS